MIFAALCLCLQSGAEPQELLDRTIALDVAGASLEEFAAAAGEAALCRIAVSHEVYEKAIVGAAQPITLRAHGRTLRSVLREVLRTRGLTVAWRDQQLTIVPAAAGEEFEPRVYDVGDVLGRIRGFWNVARPHPAPFLDPWQYLPNGEFRMFPQSALVPDPQIGIVQWGDVLDVRPIVTADRRYVILEARPTHADLQSIETVEVPFGNFMSTTVEPEILEKAKAEALPELIVAQTPDLDWTQGAISRIGSRLVINQTPSGHCRIGRLLEDLRTITP
jgi:hypothetical protein